VWAETLPPSWSLIDSQTVVNHSVQFSSESFSWVIPVDGQIQTHKLGEFGVVVAQHGSEVGGPIFLVVDGSDG